MAAVTLRTLLNKVLYTAKGGRGDEMDCILYNLFPAAARGRGVRERKYRQEGGAGDARKSHIFRKKREEEEEGEDPPLQARISSLLSIESGRLGRDAEGATSASTTTTLQKLPRAASQMTWRGSLCRLPTSLSLESSSRAGKQIASRPLMSV